MKTGTMKPLLCAPQVVRNFLNVDVGSWPPKAIDPSKPFQCQDRRPIRKPDNWIKENFTSAKYGVCGGGVTNLAPFKVGDMLYVRESFWESRSVKMRELYSADLIEAETKALNKLWWQHRPSIHMPKELSRIHLEVMRVRVERACDISEEDAKAEGCEKNIHPVIGELNSAKDRFEKLWTSLYGHDAWEKWVWVYDLKRIK